MSHIALVDPMCPHGYESASLQGGAIGGTEATVLRVMGRLNGPFNIHHYQANRDMVQEDDVGRLLPLEALGDRDLASYSTIIVINSWKVALKLRKRAAHTRIVLWLHVFPGRHNRKMGAALAAGDIEVICVSKAHADWLARFLGEEGAATPQIGFIYNPIADELAPDETPRNKQTLLFASSPHKGLREVFDKFRKLKEERPYLQLNVADPGYMAWDTGVIPKGVRQLGSLTHEALIAQMRRSLCLFYPQTSFAETFGLVIAEANAVGTPAIVHRGLGANDEIVSSDDQCIDCTDMSQIAARVDALSESQTQCRAREAFRLSAVAAEWAALLSVAQERRHKIHERDVGGSDGG